MSTDPGQTPFGAGDGSSLPECARFQAWMAWVHEGNTPLLVHARTVDLTAFRTYLIHEQAHTPATVNRRLQGLRLFFQWLYDGNWISDNPAANLRFMRKSGNPQPVALRRREVLALVHTAAASPHGLWKVTNKTSFWNFFVHIPTT